MDHYHDIYPPLRVKSKGRPRGAAGPFNESPFPLAEGSSGSTLEQPTANPVLTVPGRSQTGIAAAARRVPSRHERGEDIDVLDSRDQKTKKGKEKAVAGNSRKRGHTLTSEGAPPAKKALLPPAKISAVPLPAHYVAAMLKQAEQEDARKAEQQAMRQAEKDRVQQAAKDQDREEWEKRQAYRKAQYEADVRAGWINIVSGAELERHVQEEMELYDDFDELDPDPSFTPEQIAAKMGVDGRDKVIDLTNDGDQSEPADSFEDSDY